MQWRRILFAGSILLSSTHAAYADGHLQDKTLTGIRGFSVSVAIPEVLGAFGLDSSSIRTDAELRLRQNGIRVLSDTEWLTAPGSPTLFICVESRKVEGSPIYAFDLSVSVSQDVALIRNQKMHTRADTWEASGLGYAGEDKVSTIREGIREYVDEFLNAYLGQNPKAR